MKKILVIICILEVMMINGCSVNYKDSLESFDVNSVYSDESKISSENNSYSLNDLKQTVCEQEYTGQIEFEGMDTIWKFKVESESEVEISYSLSVTKGSAKLILINPDGELETIVESNKIVEGDNLVSTTLVLKKGENRIKLVGRDNAQIDIRFKVSDGELYKVGFDK